MKKTFILVFALVAFSFSAMGAATTVTLTVDSLIKIHKWVDTQDAQPFNVYPKFTMDDNISVAATGTSNGTLSKSRWFVYYADNFGEFTISAKEGYGIVAVGLKHSPQNGAVLKAKGTDNLIAENGAAYMVNAESIAFVVDTTTYYKKTKQTRITQFSVKYDTLPASVALSDMTVKVGQRFQIKATITPATLLDQVTWATSAPAIVAIDANGMIDVKAEGEATITATTINGKEATCTITAAATAEDELFTEDYAKLTEQVTWKSSYTEYTGALDQKFRVRNYRFSSATELTTGVAGVELQDTVNKNKINFIAYANAQQEGGAKAIAFEWRAVDGTKPVMFDVDSTQNKQAMNLVSLPANGGYEKVQKFAKELGFEQNMQLRIRIADAASSNIVFGPITITPYLLYRVKKDTVESTKAYNCASDELLINNVEGTVAYTLLEGSMSTVAIDEEGNLDMSGVTEDGDVQVQASWKGVKTVLNLHITKGTSTGIDNAATKVRPAKVIKDGKMMILRDGEYINVLGSKVAL